MNNKQKKLYEFKWNYGYADVSSLFIATDKEVQNLVNFELYLGEIAGKHSEVYGTIEESDFKVISENQTLIQELLSVFPSGLIHGINIIESHEEQLEEELDEY